MENEISNLTSLGVAHKNLTIFYFVTANNAVKLLIFLNLLVIKD
jgi:hypothetical protein